MPSLPLPLALTARLSPVAVLATAGWALASGPLAPASAAGHGTAQRTDTRSTSASGSSGSSGSSASTAGTKAYSAAPAPCAGVSVKTVKSLVPGAKTAGKEIASTDSTLRRTCSWNALKGYDYRWLDVSFEIAESAQEAQKEYKERVADKSGGGDVPGVGDAGYSVVNLTTEDKQQTREGVVVVRVSNALVEVTYSGSDFETKKAPGSDVINTGAIKAAKEAVAVLEDGGNG